MQDLGQLQLHLGYMKGAIHHGDMESLNLFLDRLSLREIDITLSNSILIILLNICYETEYGRLQGGSDPNTSEDYTSVNTILDHWDGTNPASEDMPIRTTIYTLVEMEPQVLAFVARADSKSSLFSQLSTLIWYGSTPLVKHACSALHHVYGVQSIDVYKEVREMLDEARNDDGETNDAILDFVEDMIRELEDYAPIPSWVISDADKYPTLPTHTELLASLPGCRSIEEIRESISSISLSKAVVLMMKMPNMPSENGVIFDVDDSVYHDVEEKLSLMDRDDMLDMVTNAIKIKEEAEFHTNDDIFRVLGPDHPSPDDNDLDTNSPCPCLRYGGHRLQTCTEYANMDDNKEPIYPDVIYDQNYEDIKWYFGNCDICFKKIREQHHAVRMPMPGGGWGDGCYCSWDHVRDDVDRSDPEQSQMILKMIDEFEKLYLSKGIQERTYDKPKPEPEFKIDAEEFFRTIRGIQNQYI